ncbi:hypothetical protein Dsin_016912 [Dipteronia sinensis]|uniref:Zinc knuckle CX2CX4HX4C domain-containing protein n=1 Tax=Dipteronia sinensis TaxID=43782 RepID=A0AAE0AEL3_9ROSI|nr:hypothetical protein Dsin_016912 [Dipteronia sinensis]
MVGLKYERLPEFYYACGRIGHGSKDCPDVEARIGALNGATTKFGAWMRASVLDRLKVRPHLQKEGISKPKVSSPEWLHEVSVAGPLLLRSGLLDSQSGDLTYIVMAPGPILTWNNRKDGQSNIQERLDIFLADNQWRDRFDQVLVEHLGFQSSDHRPILLQFNRLGRPRIDKHLGFRFELYWLKEVDLDRVVQDVWTENGPSFSSSEFIQKLRHCANRLVGWSTLRVKNLSKQIEGKSREIERLYTSYETDGVMHSIKILEKSVEELLDCEELF